MLSITKENEGTGWNFFRRARAKETPILVLEKLVESLGKELKRRLAQIDVASDNLPATEALHIAVENLSNTKTATEKALQKKDLLTDEIALCLLDEQIEQVKTILRSEFITHSDKARETGLQTLNLLFRAKEKIKQLSLIITPLPLPNAAERNEQIEVDTSVKQLPSAVESLLEKPRMVINSTLLFQLHHSLFPAERMLVGAGRKQNQIIEIEGIFDVTGRASSGYVKADADLLGRALIVMSETDKYFALWIHSHPGRGAGATHPSGTDLNQEAEWLKDYSPNLVNAIVVEDRYIRFWGKALKEKRISVEIKGAGVRRVSNEEEIYQLEF